MKTLLLIDAHAMIHRAFHALPPELASKKGVPTNAIYGFFLMFQKVITDFKPQIPLIEELLTSGGVTCLKKEGFEADDVIGTIAKGRKNEVDRTLILTGDRDLLQLVDNHVFVITPKLGVTNFTLFTQKEVLSKFIEKFFSNRK